MSYSPLNELVRRKPSLVVKNNKRARIDFNFKTQFDSTIPDEEKCVGIVLRVQSARSESYRVKFTFSLVDANGKRVRSIQAEKFIEKTKKICTESCDDVDLISRRELEKEQSSLLPGDALLVHVDVSKRVRFSIQPCA